MLHYLRTPVSLLQGVYAVFNIPLFEKATDLLKQIDDEDILAVISILNRLAARHK